MIRDKRALTWMLCFILLCGGCLDLKQPKNKVEYYTLEYDPPAAGNRQSLPLVIKVEPFTVSPIYNTNRIIYRDTSFKREAYVYYKWWANPGDFVTHFLKRDMQKSGLFEAVLSRESKFASSYMLEGTVDEFLEYDTENHWDAVLSVSIALIAENETDVSQAVLFQKPYRTRKPCRQKHPRALAEAMSLAMSEVSEAIIMDIYEFLKDHKK